VQAQNIRAAIATWASYIATPMTEVADNASSSGEMRIAFSIDPARPTASLGTYPGTGAGGDVWLNNAPNFASNYEVGSGYYQALLHEIGHALGLKHPFDTTTANSNLLDAQHSTKLFTVMAYENVTGQPTYASTLFPTTPMVYDVLAIQYLYGKSTTFNAGDSNYNFSESGAYDETIYDAGGVNAFVYTGKKAATIDLNQGHGSYIGQENWITDFTTGQKIERIPNVWVAFDTLIRNASGGDGNDTLIGNSADNILSGGAGIDMAVYGGKFTAYAVSASGGDATVASQADGTDTLHGVERLQFSDVAVALDIGGSGGQAYRIYQAAFNRAPDSDGLGYWISVMDKGAALKDVAAAFIASGEFTSMYGTNPTSGDLVGKFYANVLHRAPDAAGYDYWVHLLDSKALGAADVLASFSESAENQAALIGVIEHGMVFTPHA
jgi:hypothetical protein